MGLEAQCEARFAGRASRGKALLESSDLVFRGDFRLRIPFKDIRSVEARGGRLEVAFPRGVASFDLGAQAAAWALKIRYPRGLLDKLGVKPGARVSVLGIDEGDFRAQLDGRSADVSTRPRKDSDLLFWRARTREELVPRLRSLRACLRPAGAVWVVWPKGRKALREDDVRAAGAQVGLVDVKVVSFSDELSALKMMIPVEQRSSAG
jgi:hypothetical protein